MDPNGAGLENPLAHHNPIRRTLWHSQHSHRPDAPPSRWPSRPAPCIWHGAPATLHGTPTTQPCLPSSDSTALVNELGRRTPSHIGFVEPDEAGGIVIPVATGSEGAVQEARYRLATEPTPYLYVQTAYAYSDASNAIIREMGLFMDTEFVEGLPEGQRYFVPDDLKNPGLLLAAQIILPRINRSPSVRQTVEFVLPI